MTKITTDFVGSETIAVTKQRLTDILAYWGASTAAYTTWGQARTALNALLTSTTAGTIGSTELAGSFLPKINFLNDPDEMIADALFGAGEQGVWLDPSDLTTMFQDAAGTTPVYAPGQPVGLRLDKSKGLVLGPELLTNGDFSGGTTGWTTFALVDLVVTSGQATISRYADATAADLPRQAIIAAGKWYEVKFSVLARSNNVSVYVGGTEYATSSTGSYVVKLLAGSDGLGFRIGPTGFATATCTIDNVSVKELPGNHATQSTLASRPLYGIEPKGGRRNTLTYSQEFDNAAWLLTNSTPTADFGTAPDGTMTADRLVTGASSNTIKATYQVVAGVASTQTLSVYVKDNGSTARSVAIFFATPTLSATVGTTYNFDTDTLTNDANAAPFTIVSSSRTAVGSGWFRLSVAVTVASAQTVHLYITSPYSPAQAGNYLLWGAQLETGSTATAYQRVTTAFDVTEAGVNSCHYCQYDGSDDGMVTNSIDFTATDKMSVFAGVRKTSDATIGIIAELSSTFDTAAGVFSVGASVGAANYVSTIRGGISPAINGRTASTFAAPISNIITLEYDFAQAAGNDENKMRVNGVVPTLSPAGAAAGSGNFGNHPLYLGRRAGTTLPFNGRDYGILITGKAANATAIATTEMWLANKTAGVTL